MTLDDFINSPDPIVAQAATLTSDTIAAFKAGQVNAVEYAELMANILDFNAVTKLTSDMQRQNEIAVVFAQLKDIAGLVSTLTSL